MIVVNCPNDSLATRPKCGDADSSTAPFAMELREAAKRMTHFYWSRRSTDEGSSNRLAGLLYVDTN
jgi:hypothetical protein